MTGKLDYLQNIADVTYARWDRLEYDGLTGAEQIFICVWNLKGEVDNGGFDQFYWNSSGELAIETVAALLRIGAIKTARLVQKANGFFPYAMPSKDREARIKQVEKLRKKEQKNLEKLNKSFFKNPDGIDDLLYQFVVQHRQYFSKSRKAK